MARLSPGVAAIAAATMCVVPSAHAANSVFDPPRTIAVGAHETAVVVAPSGAAAIAWTASAGGIYIARRAAGVADFGPPEVVSAESGRDLQLRRNVRGDLAVAWLEGLGAHGTNRLRVAVSRVGEPFGPVAGPAAIPAAPAPGGGSDTATAPPDGVPAGEGSEIEPQPVPADAAVHRASVALGNDGRATVAFTGDDLRGAVATRSPDGPFGETVVLDGGAPVLGHPQVAASPTGPVTVVWEGQTPGARQGMDSVYAADLDAEGRPGPRVAISDPSLDAGFNFSDPTVAIGPEGEAVVVWAGSEAPQGDAFFISPTRVDVAERDAAGRWAPPHRLVPGEMPFASRLKAVFNSRSDLVVTGGTYGLVDLSFRPAGGGFGPVRKDFVHTRSDNTASVALDALGVSVTLAGAIRQSYGGPAPVVAHVREGGVPESDRFVITAAGETAYQPDIGTDAAGRGVAVWVSPDGGMDRVRYATYAAAAPTIAGLRMTRSAFVFAANRPAVLAITVRVRRKGRVRTAVQTAVARPAVNRVRLAKKMKAFTAPKGRYSVQIHSRDRGPRTGVATFRLTVKGKKAKTGKTTRSKRTTAKRKMKRTTAGRVR